jgi:hypothetical protein
MEWWQIWYEDTPEDMDNRFLVIVMDEYGKQEASDTAEAILTEQGVI